MVRFTSILEYTSNLKPIWLDDLSCTLTDSNLQACISEQNIIGFGDCQTASFAIVDCGKCIIITSFSKLLFLMDVAFSQDIIRLLQLI